MKRLIYNNEKYNNIYQQNTKSLLKISALPVEIWENFCNKNLKFVNNPTTFHAITQQEKQKYNIRSNEKHSIITLPYLKSYKTLYNTIFSSSFTTKEILQLLKDNMRILEYIHDNKVTHGDINSNNIMINEHHNIEFIDFDAATVDEYISEENTFFDDKYSTEEKIKKTMYEDKLSLLVMYFSYLRFGNFKNMEKFRIDKLILNNYLNLSKTHEQALNEFLKEKETNINYYYMDFIDDLIKENYQSPIIYSKNSIHKYNQ